jgi:hypothetical protein
MSLCVVFVKIKKETQRFERGREKGRGEREREREGERPRRAGSHCTNVWHHERKDWNQDAEYTTLYFSRNLRMGPIS